jgi:diacylglycerol kinase
MKRQPLISAFRHAANGMVWFFRVERNSKIYAACTVLVIATGILLHVSKIEWIALTLAIGTVWTAELFNSAIELLCDYVQPERHQTIKIVKDLAAGAVLFAAICSAIVGGVIFLPKMYFFTTLI